MLCKVIGIMKVDKPFLMCLHNVRWKQKSSCQILADLTGPIVALNAVDGRVFIGVFLLDFLIVALDEGQNAVVGGVMGTCWNFPALLPRCYIRSDLRSAHPLYLTYGRVLSYNGTQHNSVPAYRVLSP